MITHLFLTPPIPEPHSPLVLTAFCSIAVLSVPYPARPGHPPGSGAGCTLPRPYEGGAHDEEQRAVADALHGQ